MKTSAKGRQFIAAMEGTVLHVYLDSAGLPTAGVGHLLTVAERNVYRVNQSVTKAECDAWLAKDLKEAEDAVNNSVTVKITQNQFDALVSLAFNIGTGAFSRSVVVKKCNAGDNVGSANAFQSWNKATVNGKKMIIEGLVKRRNKERRLFLTPDSAAVPVVPQPIPRPDTQLSVSPNTAVEQPPIPLEANKIKPSLKTTLLAGTTALLGYYTMLKDSVGDVLTPRIQALSGRQFFYGLLGAILVVLAMWLWDRSRQRASAQTIAQVNTLADPNKNNVVIK
jgi:lysozyme